LAAADVRQQQLAAEVASTHAQLAVAEATISRQQQLLQQSRDEAERLQQACSAHTAQLQELQQQVAAANARAAGADTALAAATAAATASAAAAAKRSWSAAGAGAAALCLDAAVQTEAASSNTAHTPAQQRAGQGTASELHDEQLRAARRDAQQAAAERDAAFRQLQQALTDLHAARQEAHNLQQQQQLLPSAQGQWDLDHAQLLQQQLAAAQQQCQQQAQEVLRLQQDLQQSRARSAHKRAKAEGQQHQAQHVHQQALRELQCALDAARHDQERCRRELEASGAACQQLQRAAGLLEVQLVAAVRRVLPDAAAPAGVAPPSGACLAGAPAAAGCDEQPSVTVLELVQRLAHECQGAKQRLQVVEAQAARHASADTRQLQQVVASLQASEARRHAAELSLLQLQQHVAARQHAAEVAAAGAAAPASLGSAQPPAVDGDALLAQCQQLQADVGVLSAYSKAQHDALKRLCAGFRAGGSLVRTRALQLGAELQQQCLQPGSSSESSHSQAAAGTPRAAQAGSTRAALPVRLAATLVQHWNDVECLLATLHQSCEAALLLAPATACGDGQQQQQQQACGINADARDGLTAVAQQQQRQQTVTTAALNAGGTQTTGGTAPGCAAAPTSSSSGAVVRRRAVKACKQLAAGLQELVGVGAGSGGGVTPQTATDTHRRQQQQEQQQQHQRQEQASGDTAARCTAAAQAPRTMQPQQAPEDQPPAHEPARAQHADRRALAVSCCSAASSEGLGTLLQAIKAQLAAGSAAGGAAASGGGGASLLTAPTAAAATPRAAGSAGRDVVRAQARDVGISSHSLASKQQQRRHDARQAGSGADLGTSSGAATRRKERLALLETLRTMQ
jgi:hypothetical protein